MGACNSVNRYLDRHDDRCRNDHDVAHGGVRVESATVTLVTGGRSTGR